MIAPLQQSLPWFSTGFFVLSQLIVSPHPVSSQPPPDEHPWPTGHIFQSPGAHLTYRVIGPCCRLFDREQLPWPCCRLQWRGKEPSWRRIGRRLIVDLSTRRHPSYCVEIIGQGYRAKPMVVTLYMTTFSREMQNWWHTKRHYLEPAAVSAIANDAATTQQSRPSVSVEPTGP